MKTQKQLKGFQGRNATDILTNRTKSDSQHNVFDWICISVLYESVESV
jgi:hypothetical protein